ncbi:MAG: hypothetical protein LBO77_05185 [Desulfovibrio sp.]|jgi:hypothetical protein|nr:hypothetical protein [Desulfovibrio sp.]
MTTKVLRAGNTSSLILRPELLRSALGEGDSPDLILLSSKRLFLVQRFDPAACMRTRQAVLAERFSLGAGRVSAELAIQTAEGLELELDRLLAAGAKQEDLVLEVSGATPVGPVLAIVFCDPADLVVENVEKGMEG